MQIESNVIVTQVIKNNIFMISFMGWIPLKMQLEAISQMVLT